MKTPCVVCVDQTASVHLPSFCKLMYMQHRRFVPKNHTYCKWTQRLDGKTDDGGPPKHRDRKFVFKIVKNIKVVFGKAVKGKKWKKTEKATKYSPLKAVDLL